MDDSPPLCDDSDSDSSSGDGSQSDTGQHSGTSTYSDSIDTPGGTDEDEGGSDTDPDSMSVDSDLEGGRCCPRPFLDYIAHASHSYCTPLLSHHVVRLEGRGYRL